MFIKTHFGIFSDNVKKLETIGMSFTESVKVTTHTDKYFRSIPGTCTAKIVSKWNAVLARNTRF